MHYENRHATITIVVLSDNFDSHLSAPFAAAQSLKATKNFSASDWSKNFEVVFQEEEGKQNIC